MYAVMCAGLALPDGESTFSVRYKFCGADRFQLHSGVLLGVGDRF